MLLHFGINKETKEFRFGWLLLCLIGALLVPPYFEGSVFFGIAWKVFFSVVLIAAMYSVTGPRTFLVPTLILLVPTFMTVWVDFFSNHNEVAFYLDNITSMLFLGIICYHFLRYILASKEVSTNVILASMCVYLMLGFIWAALYANLNVFYEGQAFRLPESVGYLEEGSELLMGYFTYYSMVTLSTLGYGDIVPINKVAQAWAASEAMVGQFYVAIVMARLVSIHASQHSTGH